MTGRYCDEDIDECFLSAGAACLNGATCINSKGSYSCECPQGYVGSSCSCGRSNCSMHGECQLASRGQQESIVCSCDADWSGQKCEHPLVCKRGNQLFIEMKRSIKKSSVCWIDELIYMWLTRFQLQTSSLGPVYQLLHVTFDEAI